MSKPNPLYEPTSRRARILWTLFTLASVAFAVYQYIRLLIETA